MKLDLSTLIFAAGFGQLSVLVASALVPLRLKWRTELASLTPLHRQLYWTYGGYVILSIIALGLISLVNSHELASGSGLARSICLYAASFWGIRLSLQLVFDVKDHLTTWWLRAGYYVLGFLFVAFTLLFASAAFWPQI